MVNNELYHHGILGMHWGIRRYQPYSVTGPRKGGETGKEIGEAAKAGKGQNTYRIKPALSDKQRKAKIKAIRKAAAKQEKAELKAQRAEVREQKAEAKRVKTRAEFEKDKKKVLASGDYQKILAFNAKHRDLITTQELNEAINRINAEKNLKAMAPKVKSGKEKLKDFADVLDTSVRIASKGTEAWNVGASIYNSLNPDGKLPLISRDSNSKKDDGFDKIKKAALNSGDIDKILSFNSKYSAEVSPDELSKALEKAEKIMKYKKD